MIVLALHLALAPAELEPISAPSAAVPGPSEDDANAPPAIDFDPAGGPDAFARCSDVVPPARCRLDLAPLFPPAGNQGAHASCVAFAVGRHLRSFAARQDAERLQVPGIATVFSAGYVYDVLLFEAGGVATNPDCEINLDVHRAVAFIKEEGTLPDAIYSYDVASEDTCRPHEPVATERLGALSHKLRRGIDRIDVEGQSDGTLVETLRALLLARRPVLVRLKVDWEIFRPGRRPRLEDGLLPTVGLQRRSAHALVLAGYDEARQAFKVLNSAGDEWGTDGYAFVKYLDLVRADTLSRNAIYALAPPGPTPTRAKPELTVSVENGVLHVAVRGTFIDYVPDQVRVAVHATPQGCASAACRYEINDVQARVDRNSRAFVVEPFDVAIAGSSLARHRGEVVTFETTVLFTTRDGRKVAAEVPAYAPGATSEVRIP